MKLDRADNGAVPVDAAQPSRLVKTLDCEQRTDNEATCLFGQRLNSRSTFRRLLPTFFTARLTLRLELPGLFSLIADLALAPARRRTLPYRRSRVELMRAGDVLLRPAGQHHHAGADLHAAIKVLNIFVEQPDAA